MKNPNVMRAAAGLWCVDPRKAESVVGFLNLRAAGGRLTDDQIKAAIGDRGGPAGQAATQGGVMVIPLHGLILPRAAPLEESSGVMSLQSFNAWLDEGLQNDAVKTIVLDIDSPGGQVGLVADTARKILGARGQGTKIIAQVNPLAASAAYWIASAADEIVMSPSGEAGSIGVIMVHLDESKADEMMGLTYTVLSAGKYKAEGSPFGPLDEEAQAALMDQIGAFYSMFVGDVAKGRGVSVAEVRNGFGQGRVLGAVAAKAEGMVDRIATMDDTLARYAGRGVRRPVGGRMAAAALELPLHATTLTTAAETWLNAMDATLTTTAAAGPARPLVLTVTGGDPAPAVVPVPAVAPKAKEQPMPEQDIPAASPGADSAAAALKLRATNFRGLRKAHPAFAAKIDAWDEEGLSVEQVQAKLLTEITAQAEARPSLSGRAVNPDGAGKPTAQRLNAEADPARGFANHRDFLAAVMDAADVRARSDVKDERLRSLAVTSDDDAGRALAFMLPSAFGPRKLMATVGSDEQGTYSDTYGGFSIIASRLAPRPLIGFEGDPTDTLCENIPMATPTVEMEAATDKNHTSSVSGGLTVSRKAETAAASASRAAMELITLKATSTFGLSYVTEELLADSPISWLTRLSNGFELEFAAFRFKEKLRGLGGNERLGVLTALSASSLGPTISIAKETGQAADTINYQNVIKMRARCWGYSQAIWITNHDCYPQLAVLNVPVGVAGQLVYQNSLNGDRPDTLLGRPVFYSEFASAIGDQGDLILANWSQYLEGEYQPMQNAESIHVRFVNHERAMKFWKRDCGAPSWRVPLTPNKSSSTLSPFVTLDAR